MKVFFLGYLYDKLQFQSSYISVMYHYYIHPNALKCHVLKGCIGLTVCLTQCTFAIIMMSCSKHYFQLNLFDIYCLRWATLTGSLQRFCI